ncbi:MAG: hypothetical protein K1060chlam4_00922, partial [Candidatus Anoxychlamydiales bacterium]|nr:hypothetical protein [Candidatus Anoxychlamydiales bacterium]
NKECKDPKKVLEIIAEPQVLDLCVNKPGFCRGSLGIPRDKMPQLSGDVKKSFLVRYTHALLKYPAAFILPSQGEIHETKVKKLMQEGPRGEFSCDKSILVALGNNSSPIYVLDGHHRWAACKKLKGVQKIIGLFGSAENLLKEMLSFPGCRTASLEDALRSKT